MRKLIRLFVVAVALGSASGCTALDDTMVFIFGRSMRDQASFDPYENPRSPAEGAVSFSSGNFAPDPNTVMYGSPLTHDYDVPDFDQTATLTFDPILNELENPVPADAASLERGEVMYVRVCAPCHGETGLGADAYLVDRWPALQVFNLAQAQVAGYSDGYIYAMMRVGRGQMPAYGHQITHFDRWHIVNYVRTLQADFAAAQGAAAPNADGGN
ncbi:MAG: cytochrome c [Longimicrobiales bacterium]|nr:cytochrome c [Longimicrobiales bacterium]